MNPKVTFSTGTACQGTCRFMTIVFDAENASLFIVDKRILVYQRLWSRITSFTTFSVAQFRFKTI